MTDQTPENTQLFLTAPMPCPYLPGKQERKLFTHLTGRRAASLHALLSDNGFRRSQNLIYRPACEGCAACQSVRILAREFEVTARYRRILKLNADIEVAVRQPRATAEQFALFTAELASRARHARAIHPAVAAALRALGDCNGPAAVDEAWRASGFSRRQRLDPPNRHATDVEIAARPGSVGCARTLWARGPLRAGRAR